MIDILLKLFLFIREYIRKLEV